MDLHPRPIAQGERERERERERGRERGREGEREGEREREREGEGEREREREREREKICKTYSLDSSLRKKSMYRRRGSPEEHAAIVGYQVLDIYPRHIVLCTNGMY